MSPETRLGTGRGQEGSGDGGGFGRPLLFSYEEPAQMKILGADPASRDCTAS
ncbi:MAG TPA: hypothetical protein VHW71_07530 [Steroidobacteraceae bacterium]|nr:hypothetical protein [Steroidobacteraceae bacterium]